jgi:hypothetical protein
LVLSFDIFSSSTKNKKNMKNLFYLLLLCACCGIVQAQDYFIKTINITETSSDNGADIIAEEDGYIIRNSCLFNIGGNQRGGIGIIKTNLNGDKEWDNAFHFYPYDAAGRGEIVKLPNGNYLISGGRVEEGLSFQDLFTFITTNGGIYRSVVHGDAMDNRAANSLLRANKIISFTGIKQPNTGLEVYNNTLLITMDTTGIILREDTLQNIVGYPTNGSEDITLLPTNEYVLGIGAQNEANKVYGYIRKTDTIGTTLWEKKLSNVASSVAPIHLATLQNGNFVVSWIELLGGETENRGSYFVRCYNAAGDSVWQHTFLSVDYGRNIQDLHVCSNGDIIGCGYTGNFSITGNPTSWLFRLSPQGELVWLREYAYWQAIGNTMLLYGITEDPYGDIIATGFAMVYNNLGNVDGQAVLLKVNNMGCFGNGGCNDTTIVSSVVTGIVASPLPPPKEGGHILPLEGGLEGRLWVYPNPANDIVSVLTLQEWLPPQSTLQIHDMAGRLVKRVTVMPNNHGFSTFAVTDLPNGLYLLSLSADGVRLAQAKMVVQH